MSQSCSQTADSHHAVHSRPCTGPSLTTLSLAFEAASTSTAWRRTFSLCFSRSVPLYPLPLMLQTMTGCPLVLQKWESKLLASRVADFETTAPPPPKAGSTTIHPMAVPVPTPSQHRANQQFHNPIPKIEPGTTPAAGAGGGQWPGGLKVGSDMDAMRLRGGATEKDEEDSDDVSPFAGCCRSNLHPRNLSTFGGRVRAAY